MSSTLVLGATSAVASRYALLRRREGDALHLVGRNPEKLKRVVDDLEAGALCTSETADFVDPATCERVIHGAFAQLGSIDRVLIAHGDLGNQLESEASVASALATIQVNFLSVVALLIPLLNRLETQGHGRVGVITSVAGDRGRPRNYTYGSAKGALTIYLQGVRSRLYNSGISITTIKLGPVDSPMTVDHEKNRFFTTPEVAASGIASAMEDRAAEAYVPGVWNAIMPIVKNTPEVIFQRLSFLSGR
jgi:decaprenylphospho-beta-D-erythro-pentofuranosid-2-ulose 2-reductase